MWQSDLALPMERAEVLYGNELSRSGDGCGQVEVLQPNKKGSLVGFRPFPELELDESELVIGEAFERYRSGFRERSKNLLAGTLIRYHGRRLALQQTCRNQGREMGRAKSAWG